MAVRFDLVDLKLLTHIADAGSLSRGAERSHLSPPSASLRIKNMEDCLGAKLFHRQSHGLEPTRIGSSFIQRARIILRQMDELQEELLSYAQGRKGEIRLHATSSAITEFIPAALGVYLNTHPGIDVHVKESFSSDTVTALSRNDADIGIISNNVPTPSLEMRPFQSDPLVLVTPAHHPLAQAGQISAAQILAYDLVALSLAGRIHGFLTREAQTHDMRLKIKLEVENVSAACRMVEANVGISVLPWCAARRHAQTLAIRLVPLVDQWADHALWICTRSFASLPQFARDFVDLLVGSAPGDPRTAFPFDRTHDSANQNDPPIASPLMF